MNWRGHAAFDRDRCYMHVRCRVEATFPNGILINAHYCGPLPLPLALAASNVGESIYELDEPRFFLLPAEANEVLGPFLVQVSAKHVDSRP